MDAAPPDIPGILDPETLAHLLEVELARARRYEHPFTLVRVTVRGDASAEDARRVAGALRLHTRWADSVGASADGTLLVILRDTTESGAKVAVAKIRQLLREDLCPGGPDIFELSDTAWRKGDDRDRMLARLR